MSHPYSSEGDDHYYRTPQSYTRPQSFSAQQQSSAAQHPASPSAHPSSQFDRLRAARRTSRGADIATTHHGYEEVANPAGPPPPQHRETQGRSWGSQPAYRDSSYSNVTPGVDNFGEQAAGGIAGIAMGVADTHARESGLEAMRNTPGYGPSNVHGDTYADVPYPGQVPRQAGYSPGEARGPSHINEPPQGYVPQHGGYSQNEMRGNPNPEGPPPGRIPRQQGYNPNNQVYGSPYRDASPGQGPRQMGYDPYARGPPDVSQASLHALGVGAISPGMATPQSRSTGSRSLHSFNNEAYPDAAYNRYSRNFDPAMALDFDPNSIEDDGDDGLEYRNPHRVSMLSLGHSSRRSVPGTAGAAVASGGIIGTLGGMAGRNASGGVAYDAVQTAPGPGPSNLSSAARAPQDKSEWLNDQSNGSKKLKWLVIVVVAILIIGAVVGGVFGGLIAHKKSSSSSSSGGSNTATAAGDQASNGDLNANSAEIQALMNNKNLHKVFPGIDYTPINTQYPDCLKWPPSQNNVTRDLAVLSQLTNTIRLYGTDCNQTQMLLHSIDQLNLNGTIKVWLGVWQDTNTTTNARQLELMYDIFDQYGTASFKGVIVGNEILFRKDMTATQLGTLISDVRTNLTAKGINLPIATSDLGDDWTSELADEVDYLMANIHPFFAGVTAEQAASWTYTFWTGHDTILKTDISKNIISETGWPSAGGTDCGGATTCTQGSVAGIDEMNTYMDNWVCDALTNGTNYFWFEAFDEPWKIMYDTPGEAWEDKWGLMDVNRNLKPGVVIPDCGGKTVS